MFEKNDKQKLYKLIDYYLSGKIDAWTFGVEYHDCYDVELNLDTLTEVEYKVFSELSTVAARFSPYMQDHKGCPDFFYTEKELKAKVTEAKNILQVHSVRH